MKHWKTNEEMGSGFKYSKKTHKRDCYNSLEKISKHEYNTMRTSYLIRDWWSLDQLNELRGFLDDEIDMRLDDLKMKDREENCECGLTEKGTWSEELFDEFGCTCE